MEILNLRDLKIDFKKGKGYLNVVSGIDLRIEQNQIIGIAGESGSGKSISMLSLTKILPESISRVSYSEYRINGIKVEPVQIPYLRGRFISYIFQDPIPSLDPMFTIRYQLEEVYQAVGKEKSQQEMISLLEKVGLKEGRRILDSYPHQLSGGMAQRVAVALALASSARLLIADEPTTALDANLKKAILNLLLALKEEQGLSIFFISHDLDQIFYLADQIYIFYAGRVLEVASCNQIKKNPLHPYTRALLKCLPRRNQAKLDQIKGQSPGYQDLPSGCKFHPRCEKVMQICQKQEPGFYQVKKNHLVKCYLYQDG